MANYARMFFLSSNEMINHQVTTDAGTQVPLLDWVEQNLARGEEGEEEVAGYLFEEQPGISPITDFRRESGFGECVTILTRNAPAATLARTSIKPDKSASDYPGEINWDELNDSLLRADKAQRQNFLASWSSPLRVLNMLGWQFWLPDDIAFCVQAYERLAPTEAILQSYDIEWNDVMTAHRTQSYDVAIVLYESIAYY